MSVRVCGCKSVCVSKCVSVCMCVCVCVCVIWLSSYERKRKISTFIVDRRLMDIFILAKSSPKPRKLQKEERI